ncbi:hypothetical protein EJ110_NYTH33883 [Nymphaea thermarum]|nr:hypothetical protein EJ110_NYTH33883 [Nymphaea thermarum]
MAATIHYPAIVSKGIRDHCKMRRSISDPQLHCSLNTKDAASGLPTETNLRGTANSQKSMGFLPFSLSAGSIPSSVVRFFVERSEPEEGALVEAEETPVVRKSTGRVNWITRLLELRSDWKGRKRDEEEVKSGAGEEGEGENVAEDGGCWCCGVDSAGEGELGLGDVVEDAESFSKFLVRATLDETQVLAQLASLCYHAYFISEIKPDELWRYHRLSYVTSSLEKKAKAKALCKAGTGNDSPGRSTSGVKKAIRPSVAYEIAAAAASYLHLRTRRLLPFAARAHNGTDSARHCDCGGDFSSPGASKSEMAAYVAASTVTAVVAAEEEAKKEAAKNLRSLHSSPCEWFVCDDDAAHTRCFVIQGSDNLSSWQANLFFEPTPFEGMDVLVHRGIYEAAKGMYNQLFQEVVDYQRVHGKQARFRFTGHSLGGSLSVLVSLMLVAREVVPASSMLPVVTFGAPFIFGAGQRALQALGLSDSFVQSVMMHRDIVPRAFSCRYPDRVAVLLRRLSASFQHHPCLNSDKLLYTPLGELLILQPDEALSPAHPLLPHGSGLYKLRTTLGYGPLASAVRTFLNSPHPLETLSDPKAYGSEGSILRDHESANYLKAVNGIVLQRTKRMRRMLREQRKHDLWPLFRPCSHAMSSPPATEIAIGVEVL